MSEVKPADASLAIIGCGNMGEALLSRMLATNFVSKKQVAVTTKPAARQDYIQKTYGVKVGSQSEVTEQAGFIILAVKPQQLADLPILPLKAGTTVISILAGTSLSKLEVHFPGLNIARAMPNLGHAVGQGVSGLYFDPNIKWLSWQKAFVQQLFASGGLTIEVKSEAQLDALTAISGSGPAYYFWFSEQLLAAATKLGFSPTEASSIVKQTLIGAAGMLQASPDLDITKLRQRVTSKGGTTEAALKVFSKSSAAQTVLAAVQAAERRAKEL